MLVLHPTTDVARAKAFYETLFGWVLTGDVASGWLDIKAPQPPHGAVQAVPEIKTPAPTFYVKVADVANSVEKATQMGGTVLVPPTDEAFGIYSIVADPNGVHWGLWESKK